MTEAEWLASTNPQDMLEFLGSKASDRKLRLFTCFFCRRFISAERAIAERTAPPMPFERWLFPVPWVGSKIKHLWKGIQLRTLDGFERTVEMAERYADGQVSASLVESVRQELADLDFAEIVCLCADCGTERSMQDIATEAIERVAEDSRQQAVILRHIFGNPFHPYPTASWPTPIVQLADALYNGQDCGFALHDALLEADHPELAEHFRAETWHPKGCWVLDLLLGKG